MAPTPPCAACGAAGLRPHLSVAGEMGSGGLIPSTDRYGTALADIVRCPRCGHMQLDPMRDVIEHLTDPAAALGRIRQLLAPRGVLWLALPDAGSRVARVLGRRWWSVLPTHVQYFTRGSIATLLARTGFQLLEISTAPKA